VTRWLSSRERAAQRIRLVVPQPWLFGYKSSFAPGFHLCASGIAVIGVEWTLRAFNRDCALEVNHRGGIAGISHKRTAALEHLSGEKLIPGTTLAGEKAAGSNLCEVVLRYD